MCEQLDLTWTVEEDVIVCADLVSVFVLLLLLYGRQTTFELFQSVLKPFKVVFQLLQSVQHSSIRSKLFRLHHFIQWYEISHIECGRIRGVIVRRVEVHDCALALEGREHLLHAITVC